MAFAALVWSLARFRSTCSHAISSHDPERRSDDVGAAADAGPASDMNLRRPDERKRSASSPGEPLVAAVQFVAAGAVLIGLALAGWAYVVASAFYSELQVDVDEVALTYPVLVARAAGVIALPAVQMFGYALGAAWVLGAMPSKGPWANPSWEMPGRESNATRILVAYGVGAAATSLLLLWALSEYDDPRLLLGSIVVGAALGTLLVVAFRRQDPNWLSRWLYGCLSAVALAIAVLLLHVQYIVLNMLGGLLVIVLGVCTTRALASETRPATPRRPTAIVGSAAFAAAVLYWVIIVSRVTAMNAAADPSHADRGLMGRVITADPVCLIWLSPAGATGVQTSERALRLGQSDGTIVLWLEDVGRVLRAPVEAVVLHGPEHCRQ